MRDVLAMEGRGTKATKATQPEGSRTGCVAGAGAMRGAFTEPNDRRAASNRLKTVLVVDDYAEICDIVAWSLSAVGYRVLAACDPLEALKIVRSETASEIDLLITGVEMPNMRGDELAGWFSNERPQSRVLFMSANKHGLPDAEAGAFLQKPFSLEALRSAVRNALVAHDEVGVYDSLSEESLELR